MNKPFELPQHLRLGEPFLKFGVEGAQSFHIHPLVGLIEHGPYGKLRLTALKNPIRVALIGQRKMLPRLQNLVGELNQRQSPKERKDYLPEYPGFQRVFETTLSMANNSTTIILPDDLDERCASEQNPHDILAEVLTGALNSLHSLRHDFDVVYMGLNSRWSNGFVGGDDFDLHDHLKAVSASAGIALQIVREDGALSYRCRASTAWRLGIATYTKAGGIPWALANTAQKTAYIGIDYAIRKNTKDKNKFAICCAQVFDSDGAGLDFIAYEANDTHVFNKNPFLSKEQMLKVMTRSLNLYLNQHAGRYPDRIVVHKNTEFRKDEIDGCMSAFSNVDEVELLQVQQSHDWQGVLFNDKDVKAKGPCHRGQVLPLGDYEALLWTQGDIPELANGKLYYYKEGKGIPSPLLLTRFVGRGDFLDLCRETLALTKMNWNNDAAYSRLPVTLEFADVMAQIVKRMPKLETKPYPVRLFM